MIEPAPGKEPTEQHSAHHEACTHSSAPQPYAVAVPDDLRLVRDLLNHALRQWKACGALGIVDTAFCDGVFATARARFGVELLERGPAPLRGELAQVDARNLGGLSCVLQARR